MADLNSIFQNLLNSAKIKAEQEIREGANDLKKKAKKAINTVTTKFTFKEIPQTLEEMKALKEAELTDANATVALTILALNLYEKNQEECFKMLDFLNGPNLLNPSDKDFIRDRFMDQKGFVVRSYFKGATPENNYTPKTPYQLAVLKVEHSDDNEDEGYLTLYVESGGADNARPVQLRYKPSTKQWFLNQFEPLLAGVKTPAEQDPWA